MCFYISVSDLIFQILYVGVRQRCPLLALLLMIFLFHWYETRISIINPIINYISILTLFKGSGQSIQSGQISEKDIIDVLENTARQVAASTLSRSDSGQDLERDARVSNFLLPNVSCLRQFLFCFNDFK